MVTIVERTVNMNFLDIIETIVYDYFWGTPLVMFILLVGAYLTIGSGFFQFRFFGKSIKAAVRHFTSKDNDPDNQGAGAISPLEAISTAIGSTVGTGNIGGVATAIVTGGPGAIFWMWIAGFFGMIIKMTEITLAVHYRNKDTDGNPYGGPTYYIHKGLSVQKGWRKFAAIIAALFTIGFFMGFIVNIQTYTITESVATTFNLGMIPVAVIYTIVLFVMIQGGLKRIGKIASILVPFMCLIYLVGGIIVLCTNLSALPGTIGLIFKSAFNPEAAMGGIAGFGMIQVLKVGFARSVFSNEAGWGTAPMIHASARVTHPIKQGMMGVFEVFVDTFIVCTITGLVVINSGLWNSGLDGANLTLSAFETGLGSIGRLILAVSVLLFGLTTATGIYAQSEAIIRYYIKTPRTKKIIIELYKILYPLNALIMVIVAVTYGMPGTTLWICSDACTALPVIVNTLTLLLLSPKFFQLLQDYKAKAFGIGTANQNTEVFYEKDEN